MTKNDESVGLDVRWSWQGFSAKVRSRLLSAFDRRGASEIDASGLDVERNVALHRAVTDAQLTLIAASTKSLSKEIATDPELAARALSVLTRAERQCENIKGSFALAIEDLRNRSMSGEDAGPDELSPDFVNRWERYAADASSEQLREKWGRILASEVRKPNSFPMKLLRIMDEIDIGTAQLFERFCQNLIRTSVPEIINDLSEYELRGLAEAELILTEGLGYSVKIAKTKKGDETEWWLLQDERYGIVVRCDPIPSAVDSSRLSMKPLRIQDENLVMSVIALTSVGQALASILPDASEEAFKRLAEKIRGDDPEAAKFVRREAQGFVEA